MAKKVAAKITGIAIHPGISKNNRSYSTEAISKMVARAQQRITDGAGLPLVMKTSHGEDDASKVVGRLTSMKVNEQGAAQFTADIAATKTGRDIAKLVKGGFLKGVSIRGAWVGQSRTERGPAGQQVETGDDLELYGLDWTPQPGVAGALVTAAESAPGGQFRESVPVVTGTVDKAALARAETAFNAEAVAARALDELALAGRTFESLGAGRVSPAWRENTPPAAMSAEEAAAELARMTRMSTDDFEAAAVAWAGSKVAALDAARERSPFMRGLGDSLPGA